MTDQTPEPAHAPSATSPTEAPEMAAECPALDVTVRPSWPARLEVARQTGVSCKVCGDAATLENGFLVAEISLRSGVLLAVTNKVTGQRTELQGDCAGFEFQQDAGPGLRWLTSEDGPLSLAVSAQEGTGQESLRLVHEDASGQLAIAYALPPGHFWLERRLSLSPAEGPLHVRRLVYGRGEVRQATIRTLELGRFDRPRLISAGNGGIFAGVGWWFYSVGDDGVYQSNDMDFDAAETFLSEPWYVGVFATEPDEPYPGWHCYRAFLEQRKREHDKQRSWSMWNAGWGQWGIDVDDPAGPDYIALAGRLGLKHFGFGSGLFGKGPAESVRLARETESGRRNLAALAEHGLVGGVLAQGNYKEHWGDGGFLRQKLEELASFASTPGFSAFSYDFVDTADTFTAHRNLTSYFRAARETLAYTECHLGMAKYGPRCQREVLVNHPNDLHRFNLAHFSADWTTFLAFRHSRAEWQRKYDYLMPEAGLYYFATHYSNWGHPRRYTDPEPQQFLYGPHAYCSIGFNFHDHFGYRDALMGAALFSPYVIFGHLDLRMPESDVQFTRSLLRWAEENADIFREGRVCHEDDHACVLSKLRGGAGLVALYNYDPGQRSFRLTLPEDVPPGSEVRLLYPRLLPLEPVGTERTLEVAVPGDSVALLEVNRCLIGEPPTASGLVLDLSGWRRGKDGWETSFRMPDVRGRFSERSDPHLPRRLLSVDAAKAPGPLADSDPEAVAKQIGCGPLPEVFLRAFGFEDGCVETWKFVPWAFGDRAWLVYVPSLAPRLGDPRPSLTINGHEAELVPRVDYRKGQPEEWTCPLFFADLTSSLAFSAENAISLRGTATERPPAVAVRMVRRCFCS